MELSTFENVVIRFSPVWGEICQLMTHRDLHLLCCTSKSLKRLVQPSLLKLNGVDNKLKGFFKDPLSFRLILRDTGGVIAGEFARSYFLGCQPSKSLDVIMVDPRFYAGVKMTRMLRYLRRREGYTTSCLKSAFFQRGAQVSYGFVSF